MSWTGKWPMQLLGGWMALSFLFSFAQCDGAQGGQPGQAGLPGQAAPDELLLGLHFWDADGDVGARAAMAGTTDPAKVVGAAGWADYIKYMSGDLKHISYPDFWRWWCQLERYKGDEKGLGDLDVLVKQCLDRGMKIKLDVAWSTWWTSDFDWLVTEKWEGQDKMAVGFKDLDDWVHFCDLLGRRYRGQVALWLLMGESNSVDWLGMPEEHVHEAWRLGYRAFKRVDPGTQISLPGFAPCYGRDKVRDFYQKTLPSIKGYHDDVPLQYFSDVQGFCPYDSLEDYIKEVRGILDANGETNVQLGFGENCYQWALGSYETTKNPPTTMDGVDPKTVPFCEMKQAWRLNESLGAFYTLGGNRFMMHGTEFAPGVGWAWRWGLRKYEDLWGIWPKSSKVPGTKVIARHKGEKGEIDYLPAWTSDPANPYHPIWEVFKFWSQAALPGTRSIRLPFEAKAGKERVYDVAVYRQTQDRCVALIQNDKAATAGLSIDLKKTGWSDGTHLGIRLINESIDYATGKRVVRIEKTLKGKVRKGALDLKLPSVAGFTTLEIARMHPDLDAKYVEQTVPGHPEVRQPVEAVMVLGNTGQEAWRKGAVQLAIYDGATTTPKQVWPLARKANAGDVAAFAVKLPQADVPGYTTWFLRLCDKKGNWFGPVYNVSTMVDELSAPRKFVAFREVGHVRLKWFAPRKNGNVAAYEVQRADGFDKPFSPLAQVEGTDYIDEKLAKDKAYYYRVAAVDKAGKRSLPSNEDNAKAIGAPRVYDAEIIGHTIPAQCKLGETTTATVTIRNTGLRAWPLDHSPKLTFRLSAMQQWGSRDEDRLPKIRLGQKGEVGPGQSVTISFPYVAPSEGKFENHWVMRLDLNDKRLAMDTSSSNPGEWKVSEDAQPKPPVYFGTPLLVETMVEGK